jgi:hypothetical protein
LLPPSDILLPPPDILLPPSDILLPPPYETKCKNTLAVVSLPCEKDVNSFKRDNLTNNLLYLCSGPDSIKDPSCVQEMANNYADCAMNDTLLSDETCYIIGDKWCNYISPHDKQFVNYDKNKYYRCMNGDNNSSKTSPSSA